MLVMVSGTVAMAATIIGFALLKKPEPKKEIVAVKKRGKVKWERR